MSEGFRYISWGCGLQSTVLVQMVCEGKLQADAIFFADTMDEPYWVYETLGNYYLRPPCPVYVVTKGKLSEHMRAAAEQGKRWAAIPGWTKGEDGRAAPLRRQCTREYKIEVIQKAVRTVLGYALGERVKHRVTSIQGISFDELDRMSPSRIPWVTTEYPLVDARMTANDCRDFFLSRKLRVPRKSSCRYCPYHSDRYWRDMKQNDPVEFEQACEVDMLIRDLTRVGDANPVFIHRSLVPLREAYFGENQRELFREDCSGHCGV